ncbi:MAG: tyrosine-type recombinase/integrase [Acidobacteriales bacterium]|nr:tyrosine-type recombinase/integrase [Terriglobales bacterium]
MRKRFQKGSLEKVRGEWVARWRQDGERKARKLGRTSQVTKAQAQSELAAILAPINNAKGEPSERKGFDDFVQHVYLPFYRRKWKRTTVMTNEDRLAHHLTSEYAPRPLGSFGRDELQSFLDRKGTTLSFSVVDHLRWDLKQIFDMAVAEGYLRRNPALLLFTPRECRRPEVRVMTLEEVRRLFSALEVRERLIAKLALLAGMRPGEIFGLKWTRLEADYADIRQRVYRGDIDSPKSVRSVRHAALSDGLLTSIDDWRAMSLDTSADAWVFASERLTTPLAKDNCWRRSFLQKLKPIGLAWANFQVMRRTHSSLLKELDVDPQVRAEQMGHTVDVNENVYTITSLKRRKEAVNALEKAVGA